MTDDWSPDRSSDRLVEPLSAAGDPVSGDPDAPERWLTVDDDQPLLDAEGNPVSELDLARPDEIAARSATVRQLAVDEQVWRFGHVIVDEAQDLSPMQWRMLVRRSRRGAVTIVGDLAQRSIGHPGSWDDHLPPEFSLYQQQNLTINYRSPAEVNELAGSLLAELVPDLPPSRSVRRSGHRPRVVSVDDLTTGLAPAVAALLDQDGPSASGGGPVLPPAVVGFDLPDLDRAPELGPGTFRSFSPWQVKGLEFDSVVVVEPARFLDEPNGLSLLYVALTRSTDRLTIVHQRPLPEVMAGAVDDRSPVQPTPGPVHRSPGSNLRRHQSRHGNTVQSRPGHTSSPVSGGAPDRIRTCGLVIRSDLLCPAELQGPIQSSGGRSGRRRASGRRWPRPRPREAAAGGRRSTGRSTGSAQRRAG